MTPNEKIRVAKLKVLNGNKNMRLFSCLLYKYEIFVIDIQGPNKTAFVTYNNSRFEIYFDKQFIEENTSQELVYVIIHEQCHVLNNHQERGKNKENHALFNIACDHVINDRLDADVSKGHLNNIKIPEHRMIINYFHDKNVTAEEVYEYLMENAETTTEKIKFKINSDGTCSPTGKGDSSGESDSESGSEPEESESDSKSDDNKPGFEVELTKTKVTMPDGQVIEHIEDMVLNGNVSQKDIEDASKEMQGEAKAILNSGLVSNDKSKGIGSSGILELIRDAVEVPLPWDELVEHAIKSTVVVSNENKSWKNLNKRLQCHNILMPGFGNEEKVNTLVMCIDTSGSMNSEDFKKFLSIIKNSVQYFNKIIKIDHDYKITSYTEFTAEELSMSHEDMYKFQGRGGTSHSEIFEKIEDMVYEHDEDVSLVFFLTDYESDIEQLWNKFRWTKEIPIKMILTTKHKVPDYIDKSPIYI